MHRRRSVGVTSPPSSTSDRFESRPKAVPSRRQQLPRPRLRGISRIRLTRLAREETRRTVISAGTQKVNRSFARREEEEEKEDEEEEKEEETEEREGAKKQEEKKREKEEEERTTSVRGRISFTAPAAAPRVIAAATSDGVRRSSVQRVYVSARSRTSPPLLRASTRSWNTVIARPAYE